MDFYQLVESVSAIRSELNVVKEKLDAIPSGTFSSVMDSLTEITGELKDVRRKLEAGSRPSVAQPSGKNINTNSSNVKLSVPPVAEFLMKNGAGEWTEV